MTDVTEYDKLVRDRIPEKISEDRKECRYRFADDDEMVEYCIEKVREELDEYDESRSTEELADLFEVVRALMEAHDADYGKVQWERLEKKEEKGAFEDNIILEAVIE